MNSRVCPKCCKYRYPSVRYCIQCGETLVPIQQQEFTERFREFVDRIRKGPSSLYWFLYVIFLLSLVVGAFYEMPGWYFIFPIIGVLVTGILYSNSILLKKDVPQETKLKYHSHQKSREDEIQEEGVDDAFEYKRDNYLEVTDQDWEDPIIGLLRIIAFFMLVGIFFIAMVVSPKILGVALAILWMLKQIDSLISWSNR